MSNHLDPTNLSALQFNIESFAATEQACQHIIDKQIGIISFAYCRTFNNGTRLYLSNNPEWVKHYISHNFQEDVAHQESYAPSGNLKYALWTGFKEDQVFASLRDHFNLWHGFTIYERHQDYVDLFDFISYKDNPQIINYYLHNLDTLDQHVQEFKEKAIDLIDPSDKRKLMVLKNWKFFEEIKSNSLLDPEKAKNFFKEIKFDSGKKFLKGELAYE